MSLKLNVNLLEMNSDFYRGESSLKFDKRLGLKRIFVKI